MNGVLIVNPAAGGGRCRSRVLPWAARLRDRGMVAEIRETTGPGHATQLARQAAADGADTVVAVGGDGTLHEVVNGLVGLDTPPALGVLPLGTGNSFGRDFGLHTPQGAFDALVARAIRPVDVLEVTHADGVLHSINLVSVGFVAEAGALTNRRFKALGALGYVAAVVVCVARLKRPVIPVGVDGGEIDRSPCVFLSFNNSQFTGGQMQMAPSADPTDGRLDVIRVGQMGRRRLLTLFPRIFRGTHVQAPEIHATTAESVTLDLPGPIDTLVDGEVLPLQLRRIRVMPGALSLVAP